MRGPLNDQKRGLPQGALSSPILFNVFTSDMITPQHANDQIYMYADDIIILMEDKGCFSSLE